MLSSIRLAPASPQILSLAAGSRFAVSGASGPLEGWVGLVWPQARGHLEKPVPAQWLVNPCRPGEQELGLPGGWGGQWSELVTDRGSQGHGQPRRAAHRDPAALPHTGF